MSFVDDMLAMVREQLRLGAGETITYYPYQGTPRVIPAVVDRQAPEPEFVGGGEVPAQRYRVFVAQSATDGLTDPNEGFDTLDIKVQPGDLQPATFRLTRVLTREAGAFSLEVVR